MRQERYIIKMQDSEGNKYKHTHSIKELTFVRSTASQPSNIDHKKQKRAKNLVSSEK